MLSSKFLLPLLKYHFSQKGVENEERNIDGLQKCYSECKHRLFLIFKVSENCLKVSEKSGNFELSDEWQPSVSPFYMTKMISVPFHILQLVKSLVPLLGGALYHFFIINRV